MTLQTLSEHEIIVTFLALALLLAGAYLCGKLMETIKVPKVVGEITGGLLFGGTFLYHFFPDQMESVFLAYPEEGKVLNLFYQLGLVFLMFSSGFNTRIDVDRKHAKIIACVFTGATVLPMLAAIPFAGMFQEAFIGGRGNDISFLLVFIIGVAITSIPVISKIFFDMGVMNTAFTNTVLTVSTFQDLCLWIMLNVATRMATTGEVNLPDMLLVIVFTLGMFVIAKLTADHLHRGYRGKVKATDFYTVSFIALLLFSAALYGVGINIMYSAFLTGYIVKAISQNDPEAEGRMDAVANFSFSLFVPIYFALVGIQLNLIHNFSLGRFLLFFAIAFGLEAAVPDRESQTLVMSIIYDEIKQGEKGSREKFAKVDRAIRSAGCDCAILACTELSVFSTYHPLPPFYLDAMMVMAERAVERCGYPLRTI